MALEAVESGDGGLLVGPIGAVDLHYFIQHATEAGRLQDTREVDQSAETAGGVGATGEAEQEDFVAGVVVVSEEAIAVDDVVIQPGSAESASDLFPRTGTHTAPVIQDLAHTLRIHRRNGSQEFDDVGNLVAFVVGVPGAVQAENKTPFGHDRVL